MSDTRRFPAAATLAGRGVHTGVPCRLRLELGRRQGGPRFHFPGWDLPLEPDDLARLPRQAMRSTVLGSGRALVRTPEHLLAALLFFSRLPLEIRCDAQELPGMDGSAWPFAQAAVSAAAAAFAAEGADAFRPDWETYPCDLEWEQAWEGGFIRVRPARQLRVHCEIAQGSVRQTSQLEGPEAAWRGALPARTFIFHRHWREAVSAGLLAGAGPDAGLLLAESESEHRELQSRHPEWQGGAFPLLHPSSWRGENELARHKILDLLGDLALLGLRLPRLEIEIRNGGHAIHHVLLEKIIHGREGSGA